MKTRLLLISLPVMLSACSASLPHQYVCEDNQSFEAMVTSDHALVRFGDAEYQLPRIRSASGVMYELEDQSVGLYTKGKEGMLVVGDVTLRECVMQP